MDRKAKRLFIFTILIMTAFQIVLGQRNAAFTDPNVLFKKYEIGDIIIKSSNLKDGKELRKLSLNFGHLKNYQIVLEQNDLISKNYTSSIQELNKGSFFETMSGHVIGHKNSDVRVTHYKGQLSGYIRIENETYYIEPLKRYSNTSTDPGQHITYRNTDVHTNGNFFCAASEHRERSLHTKPNQQKSSDCIKIELAIALDHAYIQNYASAGDAIARSISIMNMVAGDFDDAFESEIKFEIVEHYLSSCATCDPWGPAIEVKELIDDFSLWANDNGFSKTHDIGQLWSGKNLFFFDMGLEKYGVIGYAMPDAVCSDVRYQIMEDYSSVDWNLRVLTAHEFGHNFGATHDSDGSPFIMAPNVNNTDQWSSTSVNIINSNLSNYTCTSSCNESCEDVVVMNTAITDEVIKAKDTIRNTTNISIIQQLTLDAPNVVMHSQFCINSGFEFTILSNGCE